jgi:hypothetical protein
MDSRRRLNDPDAANAAFDFIRFCHKRKRVGWPELYDEMCHVAGRGLYRGWGFSELAEHGIAFGLSEMPRLAVMVTEIVSQSAERHPRMMVGVMAPVAALSDALEEAPEEMRRAGAFVGVAG